MNQILAKRYKKLSVLILIMILTSLYFNIIALANPFLTIHHLIREKEIYSIFAAVKMMWGYKLYIVSILIIGFSIIFPFIKLTFLFLLCFVIKDAKIRCRIISIIEPLAKWSMLDVFVICMLLVLTNEQIFISSVPDIGIYYFLIAIFISIFSSIIISILCEKTYPVYAEKLTKKIIFIAEKFTATEKAVMIILVIISIIFFAFAITDNYIKVSEFLLYPNKYSILHTFLALMPLSKILAWFFAFVLFVFPFIIFNDLLLYWCISYQPDFHITIFRIIIFLSKFMMLDVFCLALILLLVEGKVIIQTESSRGIYMLELYVFMSFFIPIFMRVYFQLRYYFNNHRYREKKAL